MSPLCRNLGEKCVEEAGKGTTEDEEEVSISVTGGRHDPRRLGRDSDSGVRKRTRKGRTAPAADTHKKPRICLRPVANMDSYSSSYLQHTLTSCHRGTHTLSLS